MPETTVVLPTRPAEQQLNIAHFLVDRLAMLNMWQTGSRSSPQKARE